MTLTTCHPKGSSRPRLVVHARPWPGPLRFVAAAGILVRFLREAPKFRTRSVLVVGGVLLAARRLRRQCAPSQSDVEDEVTRILVEDGYQDQTFDQAEAEDAAECIARRCSSPATSPRTRRRRHPGDRRQPADEDPLVSIPRRWWTAAVGEATTSGPDARPAGDDTEG